MVNKRYEWGALLLRVVLGITFFIHGWAKFQGGMDQVVEWFATMAIPGFMAYGVALLELVGGLALLVGLGSRLFSSLFALLMVAAIIQVKLTVGFLGNGEMPGYELDLALLAMSLYITINGSRLFALERVLFREPDHKRKSAKPTLRLIG